MEKRLIGDILNGIMGIYNNLASAESVGRDKYPSLEDVGEDIKIRRNFSATQTKLYGNGNGDFPQILSSFCGEKFVQGLEPIDVRSDEDIITKNTKYLQQITHEFWKKHGITVDERTGENSFRKALSGESDFFDSKGYMMVVLFSALDDRFEVFSKGTDDFDTFYRNYSELYMMLNNTKLVPFYPRWISEIATIYTIYMRGTDEDYKNVLYRLSEAYTKAEDKPLTLYTDTVRESVFSIMKKLDRTKESTDRVALCELCAYISEHKGDFVDEYNAYENADRTEDKKTYNGAHSTRFRRSYCAIVSMLEYIGSRWDLEFLKGDACRALIENEDYSVKDEHIAQLELDIARELCTYCEDPDGAVNEEYITDDRLSFLIAPPTVRVKSGKREKQKGIVFAKGKIVNFYYSASRTIPRTVPEMTDSVLGMLRIIVAVCSIYDNKKAFDPECIKTPRSLISSINYEYRDKGVLSLPERNVTTYTGKSLADVSIFMYINRDHKQSTHEREIEYGM